MSMFIVIQHPLADVRQFLGPSCERLARPIWPLPEPGVEFIRSSGSVLRRKRGGLTDWSGEDVYCDAASAIRFPNHLGDARFGSGTGSAAIRSVFRRFYSAGVVARTEVGLAINAAPGQVLATKDVWPGLLSDAARIPIRVGGGKAQPLIGAGPGLARHYLASTTRKKSSVAILANKQNHFWISAGNPCAVVELADGETIEPAHAVAVETNLKSIQLRHAWLSVGPTLVSTWLMACSAETGREEYRRLRMHLLRLHAERECLRLVLRAANAGMINLYASETCSNDLQRYLNDSIRVIQADRRFGIEQSSIQEAAMGAEDAIDEGRKAALLSVRRQIGEKIDAYLLSVRRRSIVINNVSGDQMNTTLQLGNVSVSGNFNIVTAKQINDSFNAAGKAGVSDELKNALQSLAAEVAKLAAAAAPEKGEAVAKDLSALTAEATSAQPRKSWCQLSADGLIDAAKAVAGMAEPITIAVKAVLALLTFA